MSVSGGFCFLNRVNTGVNMVEHLVGTWEKVLVNLRIYRLCQNMFKVGCPQPVAIDSFNLNKADTSQTTAITSPYYRPLQLEYIRLGAEKHTLQTKIAKSFDQPKCLLDETKTNRMRNNL